MLKKRIYLEICMKILKLDTSYPIRIWDGFEDVISCTHEIELIEIPTYVCNPSTGRWGSSRVRAIPRANKMGGGMPRSLAGIYH
jgi:hypothetical protein